jgi:tRNA dimethylallyltransferase
LEREKESAYDSYYFVLTDEREKLYHNIDIRVDMMFEEGLVNEVRALMEMGCKRDSVAMQGLGYKEVIDYLEGETTLEEAIYKIKRDTRHFAKRQLTWFRRERNVIWINKTKFDYDDNKILQYMIDIYEGKKERKI